MNGKLMEVVRAIVMPMLTLGFGSILGIQVLRGENPPEWFVGLTASIITWWFARGVIDEKGTPP